MAINGVNTVQSFKSADIAGETKKVEQQPKVDMESKDQTNFSNKTSNRNDNEKKIISYLFPGAVQLQEGKEGAKKEILKTIGIDLVGCILNGTSIGLIVGIPMIALNHIIRGNNLG